MSIKQDMDTDFKQALKGRDTVRLDAIRQIKTEAAVAASEPGFADDPQSDEFLETVISAFVKRMSKAKAEYETYGERGAEMAAKLGSEVDYLSTFLPEKADAGDTETFVKETILDLGVTDIKEAGRVIGHILKQRGDLDGALVNKLVRQTLGV